MSRAERERPLVDLPTVGASTARDLSLVGYETVADVAAASPAELAAVPVVDRSVARRLHRDARDVVGDTDPDGEVDWLLTVDSSEPDDTTAEPEVGSDQAVTVAESRGTTGRWNGLSAAVLVTLGIGIWYGAVTVILLAIVPIVFLAYARTTSVPSLSLQAERSFDTSTPTPGTPVTVSVTVRNVGDRTVADCRLTDVPPDDVAIVSGEPRSGASLRPGDETTFEYVVRPKRGTHEFGDVVAVARDLSGATEHAQRLYAPATLHCAAEVESLPLRRQPAPRVGDQTTDIGGPGMEFHAVREYRSGDPMKRIDWGRLAKTGDLATVEYREERSACVVIVVDVRSAAAVASRPDELTGVEYGAYAGERLVRTLVEAGHSVGLAAIPSDPSLLEPGAGGDHLARALVSFEGGVFEPVDEEDSLDDAVDRLLGSIPGYAQVVWCSPFLDDEVDAAIDELRAHDHRVTVLSPDVTHRESPGGVLASIERQERLRSLRERDVRVIDWDTDDPLGIVLERLELAVVT